MSERIEIDKSLLKLTIETIKSYNNTISDFIDIAMSENIDIKTKRSTLETCKSLVLNSSKVIDRFDSTFIKEGEENE